MNIGQVTKSSKLICEIVFAYWNILLRNALAKYAILVHLYVVFMKKFFIHQKKTYLTLVLREIKKSEILSFPVIL